MVGQQGDFFAQLSNSGNDGLRKRGDRGQASRGFCGDELDKGQNPNNKLVKAVVVQTGFYSPSVRIEVYVNADSILLQRISARWPSVELGPGTSVTLAETKIGEFGVPMVCRIPKALRPTYSHIDDTFNAVKGLAITMVVLLVKNEHIRKLPILRSTLKKAIEAYGRII